MLEIGLLHNGASSLPIVIGEDGVTFNDGSIAGFLVDRRARGRDLLPAIALFAAPLDKSSRVDLDSHTLGQSVLRHYPTPANARY